MSVELHREIRDGHTVNEKTKLILSLEFVEV